MVFVCRSLLEKEASVVVKDKDGECAVEPSFLMGTEFVGSAEWLVIFINQHDG